MEARWNRGLPFLTSCPFPEEKLIGRRYYTDNEVYSTGDSLILFMMLNEFRPQRIVEIGSGFSSACMLDSAEHIGIQPTFTFIEPDPERLLALIDKKDLLHCTIIAKPVQRTELATFTSLQSGDLLFIDSTHVSKTGSDVNFELFDILPALNQGVLVHFHDVFYPFEYLEHWIFDVRRSWNENYILRAFLMYNRAFEILFFNDYFARQHRKLVEQTCPRMLLNPGGGLWLRKNCTPSA